MPLIMYRWNMVVIMSNEVTTKAALVLVDNRIEFFTPSEGDALSSNEEQAIHFMEGVFLMLKNDVGFQQKMIRYAQSCPVSVHNLRTEPVWKH